MVDRQTLGVKVCDGHDSKRVDELTDHRAGIISEPQMVAVGQLLPEMEQMYIAQLSE